ncbi:MAG: GAF domain-containing protein [Verrucomicrobiota bacterium]
MDDHRQQDVDATGGELLLLEQKKLLQMIATGVPLDECLSSLCSAVPRLSSGTRACILLADENCETFPRAISPDLLPSFSQGLKDAPINDLAIGTCGEALFRGQQVACGNIATEPKWSKPWRDLCIAHGVMACVSEPILGSDGTPFGSFMLCFSEPSEPTDWEQRMIRFGTYIASIALTRDHTTRALIRSEERYHTLFESIDLGFCVIEMCARDEESEIDFRLLEANPMFDQMAGLKQVVGRKAREISPELGDDWFEMFANVATGGESVRVEKAVGEQWYEVYSYRVDKPEDRRIAILFRDITARIRSERNLEFLASISHDLTRARSVDEMMRTVGASIGGFLELSTCAFVEIDEDENHAVVTYDWHREDMENTLGVFPMAEYVSKDYQPSGGPEEVFVVNDTSRDPRVDAASFGALKVIAFVSVPYVRDGRSHGCLAVSRSTPHVWREDEIDLLKTLARRILTRLENARIEEALHESERKLRQIFEGAKDYAIFSLDTKGSISSWSPGAERLFGYEEKEVMGKHTDMIFTPEDREKHMAAAQMSGARETGVAEDDRWHQRKDGSRFFASGLMQPIFDRSGQHTGFTKICRDRTAHQHNLELLERELTDSQRLQAISARLVAEGDFSNLLEEILHASIAITHSDMGTVQLVEGEGGEELRLLTSAGFQPGVLSATQHVDPAEETSCSIAIRAGERVVIPDLEHSDHAAADTPHGKLVAAGVRSAQWTPLISRSGRLVGIIATHWRETHQPDERELRLMDLLARQAADLIERHQSEGALREREQQLVELSLTLERRVAQRTAELQKQTARLQSLAAELASAEQRERKRLAALLHDDLQQLLVAAGMQLEMAADATGEDGAGAAAVRRASIWIEEARNAARDLTRQLRPPALYEDGLVAALHWLASEMEERHHLVVSIDGSEPARNMTDDTKALLFECVREMLFNVAKYAGVDRASVELREEDGSLEIVVTDVGVGFDVKTVGASRPSGGFGLFSIRERLAALGGEMNLISAPGQGTRIALHVPLAIDPTSLTDKRRVASSAPSDTSGKVAPASGDARIRVLVVDDHPMIREGIANIIDSDSRLVVSGQASDGFEAISAVEQHPPDVVLMDVNMPRMNGIEATREIRRRWPATCVIGISVQDDPTTAKSICDAGASGFISKAGASDAIIAAIVNQLPRKSLASAFK